MSPQIIPINEPERFSPAGIPFTSEHQARWAFRQSHENGLAGAFVRIGRRVYLDVPKFHELVSKNSVAEYGHR